MSYMMLHAVLETCVLGERLLANCPQSNIFATDNVANLEAPEVYKFWYQSMYTIFGNKWAAMHKLDLCGHM